MSNYFDYDIVSIMPDYGGAYLWAKSQDECGIGGNIADSFSGCVNDNLPISATLQLQFHQWQLCFEQHYFYPDGFNDGDLEIIGKVVTNQQGEIVEWNWTDFHKEGLRLAQCLKQELGNKYKVYYVKPYEDFDAPEKIVEVLLDGTIHALKL